MKPLISLILILSCNYSLALHDMLDSIRAIPTTIKREMKHEIQKQYKIYMFNKNIKKTDFSKEEAKQGKDIETANSEIRQFLKKMDADIFREIPQLLFSRYDKQSLFAQLNTFRDNTIYRQIYINPLFFENIEMQCVKSGELYFCILTNYLNGRLSLGETRNKIQQLLNEDAIRNPPISGQDLIDRWERAGRFLDSYSTTEELIDLRGNIELTGDLEYDKIVNYFIWWNITHSPTSENPQDLATTRKVALVANESWDNIFYYFHIKYNNRHIVSTGDLCDMLNTLMLRYIYTKVDYSKYTPEACQDMFQRDFILNIDCDTELDMDIIDMRIRRYLNRGVLQHIDEIPALLPPSIL